MQKETPFILINGKKIFAASDWEACVVKWYNTNSGLGFLLREGQPDIIVHRRTVIKSDLDTLSTDQRLLVRYGRGPRGLVAVELKLS